jgi:hypothetical protein
VSENEMPEVVQDPEDVPNTERGLLQSTLVRIVLVLLVVGVLAVIVGVVAFISYRNSHNKPLDIDIYPGAKLVSDEDLSEQEDHQQYTSSDSMEDIEHFYDRIDDMECERQYRVVQERPDEDPLREGHLFTRCRIDHSWLDISQYAVVTIQPVYDADEQPTGDVIIDIRRYWGD